MAGEYGIGQGVAAGLQLAAQGFNNAETASNRRLQAQQEAAKTNAYLQTSQLQNENQQLQIQQMQLQLTETNKQLAKRDTYDVLSGYEQSGDASILNTVKDNPTMKGVLEKMGVSSFNNIKDYSEEKLKALGVTPEMLADKTKRIVVINRPDGSTAAMDMMPIYATTGFLPKLGEQKLAKLTLEKAEAEATKASLETDDMVKWLEANPTKTLQDYKALDKLAILESKAMYGMGGTGGGGQTAEMKNLNAITDLKMKVDNGIATPEEQTMYDVYLTKQGGTAAAKNETLKQEVTYLAKKNIDLNDPNFNISNLGGKDKAAAEKVIRELEGTEGGKKLVSNVSTVLEKDLGAVEVTANKLADMATNKDVKTNVVYEALNQVKAYLPSEFKNMTEADLKDAQFRQAFLSVSSVFLKLQSGLTVSDREMSNFSKSFGTLSKNEKVNMIGLKTKLDETIGAYEKNSVLEPTLYNAKYKSGVAGLKQVSNNIDSFINGTSNKPKGLTPEDNSKLDSIFGGR